MIRLAARGVSAAWDPACGHLPELVIDGVDVLHRAPWRSDPAIQADTGIPPVDRRLGGSFACAPFGRDDADHGPPHGLAANAPWQVHRVAAGSLRASRALSRGHLTAQITLRDGHPVLYQTHLLDLRAPCSFAHHPMVALARGGRISTNAVRVFTFDAPSAEGTALYLPGQDTDGPMLDTAQGPRDWRDYPDTPCDDFLALWHPSDLAPDLAWTAIARAAEGDTILMLKRAGQLPLTGLWLSNGARQGPPWRGRAGVLGIEDGRFAGADGFAAALDGRTRVPEPRVFAPGRHVIAHAVMRLPGAHEVQAVMPRGDTLVVRTGAGEQRIPFDPGVFA